ncbi:MAG TPA: fasciclin domain-containing protein [Anditalea sp.]|nr:fasciclin domain-containing protein [Anditalea sp.]
MKKLLSLFIIMVMISFSSIASKDDKIKKDRADQAENKILDVAVQSEFLTILVKAIQAGDLASTLQGDGPFTVFAPTNEAFNKLPGGTLEELMQPANRAKLQEILNNHVVQGKIMSKDLSDGQNLQSISNRQLNLRKVGNQFMINGATITSPDVLASNGVIHIIDTLMLPKR